MSPPSRPRGYRSRLDESVQPYAVTLPADWNRTSGTARRLDVVLLGRGEKRTELAFIAERERPPGANDILPSSAIVLHPYGRYCNATKFAGEVDVFEALQSARTAYPVDRDRIVVRGFSMGGASTWHLPDFAIIDLREPPGRRWPGKIVDAGFFDEAWRVDR